VLKVSDSEEGASVIQAMPLKYKREKDRKLSSLSDSNSIIFSTNRYMAKGVLRWALAAQHL
jgi:hypothetical protein